MMMKRLCVALLLMGLVGLAQATQHHLEQIRLPPGFSIDIYADHLPNARSMALGDKGTLFVGTRTQGEIYAVHDHNGDGLIDEKHIIARHLDMPNGIAFRDGALYVAESGRILRFDDIEDNLHQAPAAVVIAELPAYGHHGWRYLGFDPDGLLYVSLGAPCNVCESEGLGTILRMRSSGTGQEVYAKGVRNSVGFTWHPETDELWFTDNGRDMLGDDLPPDELNHAPRPGMHFGFPYCHGGNISDPEFGRMRQCSEFAPPAQLLGPHVASLGIRFYTGQQFPAEFHNQLFIAEHGSWNRSEPIGYRISLVRFEQGKPVAYETFAEGWLQDGRAWGRPVDLLVMPDGALLVSDDQLGVVYRISYR
jgi:glucose/arabinose dehydrogenase